MTELIYEPETKTIRTLKENYWIATVDSWDKAIAPENYASDLVHRYNVHTQLVEALQDAESLLAFDRAKSPQYERTYLAVQAALDAVERMI